MAETLTTTSYSTASTQIITGTTTTLSTNYTKTYISPTTSTRFRVSSALSGNMAIVNTTGGSSVTVVSSTDTSTGTTQPTTNYIYDGTKWVLSTTSNITTNAGKSYTNANSIVVDNYGSSAQQGYSCAMSSNAEVLAVSGPFNYGYEGGIWIYTKSTTNLIDTWSQVQLITDLSPDPTGDIGKRIGYKIGMSDDGRIIIFNYYNYNASSGVSDSCVIYTKSTATSWVFTQRLNPFAATTRFAESIAISGDGSTIAIGNPSHGSNVGAVHIYTLNTTWTLQDTLVGTGYAGSDNQGRTVCLSYDGNTVAFGSNDNSRGGTWIFIRTNGVWSQQGAKIANPLVDGNYRMVTSISGDGNTLIISSLSSGINLYIYTRTAGVWSLHTGNLYPASLDAGSQFGSTTTLNYDGTLFSVGAKWQVSASNPDYFPGGVWVYKKTNNVWAITGVPVEPVNAIPTLDSGDTWVEFGMSVYMCSNGTYLIAGGTYDDTQTGALWVYKYDTVNYNFSSKLVGTGAKETVELGGSVAMSDDGNTIAMGARFDNFVDGAVWIFIYSNNAWTQQQKISPPSSVPDYTGNRFGAVVKLSSNGNTLIVLDGNGNTNYVYIYTRTAGVWTLYTYLTATDAPANVSLSADGNTLAVSATNAPYKVWIYTLVSTVWTLQTTITQGSGNVGATTYYGWDISLSENGDTIAIAGSGDNTDVGATWIFVRVNSVWSQQGSKLVGSSSASGQYQGNAIALSRDGNSLFVVSYSGGYLWVFNRTGVTWSQTGSRIDGISANATSSQMGPMALSADGLMLAIGAPYVDSEKGAVCVYTKTNNIWSQNAVKIVAPTTFIPARQGTGVALSYNGNRLLLSAIYDDVYVGTVWVMN